MAVVDDEPLICSLLAEILGAAQDIRVVGTALDGEQAVQLAASAHPNVVLMDIHMPRLDGIAATARIRRSAAAPAVLVLTSLTADEYVPLALEAGAIGFLHKDASPQTISAAVRLVAAGEPHVDPQSLRALISHLAGARQSTVLAASQRELAGLSAREREVVAGVGMARSNAQIAAALFMSERTVKAHLTSAMTKLGKNRIELALLAERAGLYTSR